MDTFKEILVGIPWFAWIAIFALLFSTVKAVIRMTHTHEERMERIKLGLDPDQVNE